MSFVCMCKYEKMADRKKCEKYMAKKSKKEKIKAASFQTNMWKKKKKKVQFCQCLERVTPIPLYIRVVRS